MADTKNYRQIAKSRIRKPKDRPRRILVYSRNKKGKTTFCASAGNVLIIDPEDGTDHLKKINPDVWPVTKWEDLDEVYKFLRLGDHNYDWVAVDGITRIANMALRWVMKQTEERSLDVRPAGNISIREYGRSGEMMKGLLYNLHTLPVGVIYTAQERMQQGENPDDGDEESEGTDASYVPDLPKGVRSTVNSLVDVIGRLYTVRTEVKFRNKETKQIVTKEVTQRRLWLEPTVSFDTGYRSDFVLPSYLKNPTIPRLVQLLQEGQVK